MSSLKDWYRYVDSKARSRPEEAEAPERDRSAEERREGEGRPAAETGAPAGGGESAASGRAGEADEARATSEQSAAGEEGLDVWGGLFPQPRKPEPKPTTAPLRRPTARLDEVPPDLPFTRTPIDSPPAPRFELPEAGVEVPRFDEFIPPLTTETPSPVTGPTPSPVGEQGPPPGGASEGVSQRPASGEPQPGPLTASAGAASPTEGTSPVSASASAGPPETDRGTAAASLPDGLSEALEALESAEAGEDGQVRWHSPFPLPGPGRTVSSGAPSPRPEPVVPRQIPGRASSGDPAPGAEAAAESVPSRPAPGTEAWERERVERLARTFRETLRALEQSLAAPPVATAGTAAVMAPATAPAPDRIEPERSSPTLSPLGQAIPPPTVPVERLPITETPREVAERAGAEAGETAAAAIPPVEGLLISPSPRLPISPATPDVLRNIEEAALIRQRLPQHMAMMLRIPTNEVAQNSYKSPFRESREDLIGRLLDPQLTLEEAARILGVCPTTVRRYTNRGMLHCHRTPGNQRRFRMSDVLQFLEQYGDRIDRAAEARQMETAA